METVVLIYQAVCRLNALSLGWIGWKIKPPWAADAGEPCVWSKRIQQIPSESKRTQHLFFRLNAFVEFGLNPLEDKAFMVPQEPKTPTNRVFDPRYTVFAPRPYHHVHNEQYDQIDNRQCSGNGGISSTSKNKRFRRNKTEKQSVIFIQRSVKCMGSVLRRP